MLASQWIIPQKEYQKFTSENNISKLSIINSVKSIGIHPCMVVGRVQHDNFIDFNEYNYLIPQINIPA